MARPLIKINVHILRIIFIFNYIGVFGMVDGDGIWEVGGNLLNL